jgi:predicted DCC family thiol-disulfide oxidoreductase YuxK
MIFTVFVSNKKLFHKILIQKQFIANMNIRDLVPIVIYDDKCYLCSKVASIVHTFAKDKILIVGHYSDLGMKIKSEVFKRDYDSTIMFWFITKKIAYGGRAAILPLLQSILIGKSRTKLEYSPSLNCTQDCRTSRAFFTRTKSLLSNSEKISLKN